MGRKPMTHEEFDAKLAVKNPKVIRVGIYKNNCTKTEFKCLIHNQIGLSRPTDVLRGQGLSCCSFNEEQRRLAAESYDDRLKQKNPKIVRLGEYVSTKTKIKFKCLIHNQIGLSRPTNVLRGQGLSCCSFNEEQRRLAAESYDDRLKQKNPKIVRLGEYVSTKTKIKFKCLIHNEVHLARPESCLSGKGLTCCGKIDTLRHSIKFGKQPTELYLFNLSRFSEYVKVGISKNSDNRKNEEYGEQILIKRLNSRAEAYVLEQAILQDKTLTRDCPEEMYLNRWPGWTEVRKCSKDVAKQVVESYLTELETSGLNVFAKKHLTLTRAEKALLDKKFPPP